MTNDLQWFFVRVSALIVLAVPAMTLGQQSANYRIEEHALNSGGNPAGGGVLTSPGYTISLDALGDTVALGQAAASPGFQVRAGFVSFYLPPGETLNLRFTNTQTLVWDPERSTGSYNLYRGLVSGLASGYGTCLQATLVSATATDASVPAPGQAYFYLVTAENPITEEGTMGANSAGAPRVNGAPCP